VAELNFPSSLFQGIKRNFIVRVVSVDFFQTDQVMFKQMWFCKFFRGKRRIQDHNEHEAGTKDIKKKHRELRGSS
jgi:hypothetical protein